MTYEEWFDEARNREPYLSRGISMIDCWNEGVGIGQQQAETKSWISVADKLPAESGNVLLCMGGKVGIGGFSPNFGWWGTGADFDEDARVTHWMPLPAAPSNDPVERTAGCASNLGYGERTEE